LDIKINKIKGEKMIKKIGIILVFITSVAYADGVKAINNFLQDKNSTIRADFVQTIFGVRKNTVSKGTMEISRPNKFRWQYATENGVSGQLIVSDGKSIYVYDKDLAQVTEKKLTNSIDRSPALLLAGGSNLHDVYTVTALPASSDGLDWVSLRPKKVDDNNGFKLVKIGFNQQNGTLAEMKFVDSFDNKSRIVFSNVKTAVKFSATEFQFLPAPGVDVVKSDN
jgi:outer membrane lipoprotein carrier protein